MSIPRKQNEYAFELLYDGESAVATLPAKHYNYVNYVVDKFRKYLDDNDTLYYIDQKWAIGFLKEI